MKVITVVNRKGGVGKDVVAHGLCFGLSRTFQSDGQTHIILLYHTDVAGDIENPVIRQPGRPYLSVRGKKAFTEVVESIERLGQTDRLIVVVNGGANRAEVDKEIAEASDLVLVPVTHSDDAYVRSRLTFDALYADIRKHKGKSRKLIRFVWNQWPGDRERRARITKAQSYKEFDEINSIVTMETRIPDLYPLKVLANYSVPMADHRFYGVIFKPLEKLVREVSELLDLKLVFNPNDLIGEDDAGGVAAGDQEIIDTEDEEAKAKDEVEDEYDLNEFAANTAGGSDEEKDEEGDFLDKYDLSDFDNLK